MMSMSCKAQTEAFAKSLQSKLRFLDFAPETDDDQGLLSYPGTTFPPRRCAHFDLLRSKYHSESDLAPKIFFPSKASKKEPSMEDIQSRSEDDHDDDSDLFFDFDIGSPQPEADGEQSVKPDLLQGSIFDTDGRRDSTDSSAAHSDGANATSTAYGSASPGLSSDLEGLHVDYSHALQVDLDGVPVHCCFKPNDWLVKQQILPGGPDSFDSSSSGSSSMSPPSGDACFEKEKLHHGAMATGQQNNKNAADPDADADTESISVFTGDLKQHKIAHSKLNALIALLEKDKEYARHSPPRSKESSPSSNDDDEEEDNNNLALGVVIPGSPKRRSSYRKTLPTISASPANFSFLSTSVSAADSNSRLPYSEHQPLARSVSTPVLTTEERALIESPRPKRKQASVEPVNLVLESEAVEIPETTTTSSEPPYLRRRASSLKSGKTPPGTPGRRKIVRFADVFGLDLADVKTFLDEVPKVPKSAYKDLKNADLSGLCGDCDQCSPNLIDAQANSDSTDNLINLSSLISSTSLVPMFNQPSGFANFFDLLRDRKVILENAFMADPRAVKGTVRVQNIGFRKRLTIRYTTNEWISSADLEAQYIQGSCDGFSDKFTFLLSTPEVLGVGQRLQFCLRFQANEAEYWDNNGGKNYVFQCLSNNVSHPNVACSSSVPVWTQAKESAPIAMLGGRSDMYSNSSSFSHSPAMTEEPWLRYL